MIKNEDDTAQKQLEPRCKCCFYATKAAIKYVSSFFCSKENDQAYERIKNSGVTFKYG